MYIKGIVMDSTAPVCFFYDDDSLPGEKRFDTIWEMLQYFHENSSKIIFGFYVQNYFKVLFPEISCVNW